MKVAIAGFGTIGRAVGRALDSGIDGLTLVAVSSRDVAKAERAMAEFRHPVPVLPLADLAERADVVCECVPKEAFRAAAEPALRAGRTLVTVSAAGLLAHPEMVDIARESGGRIVLATGALLGLDLVRAAREGPDRRAPHRHAQAPALACRRALRGGACDRPRRHPQAHPDFRGLGARGGGGVSGQRQRRRRAWLRRASGPDATRLEIWADPAMTTNRHTVDHARRYRCPSR